MNYDLRKIQDEYARPMGDMDKDDVKRLINEVLNLVEKEVAEKLEEHDYIGKVITKENISTVINNLRPIKEIEEKV